MPTNVDTQPGCAPLIREIKREMRRQGLTQLALADIVGLSRQGLSKKVNGHSDFTYTEVSLIAQALGMTHADLVARAEAAAATPSAGQPTTLPAVALAATAPSVAPCGLPEGGVGPSRADLEAHVEACDSCVCAEDALEHARQAAGEVA